VVVDDAHWADGASLRFLAFLLPRLEELRAAVLLGARPAEAGESQELLAALMMDPATEVVTVAPLTTGGWATMVAAGMGVEPEPQFAAACWEATGGTPFLVRTLVEALRAERIAPVGASAADVQNLATATLGRWACWSMTSPRMPGSRPAARRAEKPLCAAATVVGTHLVAVHNGGSGASACRRYGHGV